MQNRGVNWTIVVTCGVIALLLGLTAPVAWRATARASAVEIKRVGTYLLVLLGAMVLVGSNVLTVWVHSKLVLSHIAQDDRDEMRKNQQLLTQMARVLANQPSAQGTGGNLDEIARAMMSEFSGAGLGPDGGAPPAFRDTTQDVRMG